MVLGGIGGKKDAWFAKQLKDAAPDLDGESGDEDAAMPAFADGVAGGEVAAGVAPIATVEEWARCIVDMGLGARQQKVYLDHITGGSINQRGFTNCRITNTILYKQCFGTKPEFVVGMCLWYKQAVSVPDIARDDHLAYWPSVDAVRGALAAARFVSC